MNVPPASGYIGRLAPSPTGLLHLGHARTFWIAAQRTAQAGGSLRLRNDDLDHARCRPEFVAAMQEDLQWLDLRWQGPMISQSERHSLYHKALARLHATGLIFPCRHSRRDVQEAAGAPHEAADGLDEPLYPLHFRPPSDTPLPSLDEGPPCNWRFRVPEGERLAFIDGRCGEQTATAGLDFGDFLVWRKDGVPSYQLACVVDDIDLGITEVVRGEDLIRSTFRQLLLFRALGATPPAYVHCPLSVDNTGERLAKRHDALSLRTLRSQGIAPKTLTDTFAESLAGTIPITAHSATPNPTSLSSAPSTTPH